MKTYTVEAYQFDELSDEAKDKAREWYRTGALDYEWWESTYEDASNVGLKLTGFDLERNRHAEGSFTRPASEVARKVIAEHGAACETRATAEAFLRDWQALVTQHADAECDGDCAVEELEADFLKSSLEDYSILLQKEYEWLLSDEQVDESIRANEYEFTIAGKWFVPVVKSE